MILKSIFSIILVIVFCNADSQDYKFVYYLDGNFNSTAKAEALIVGKGYKKDERFVLDCFSKATEKKVLSASFIDSSLGTLDGLYRSYYDDMKLESEGNYTENDMNGIWKTWNKFGLITDSVQYDMGNKTTYATYNYTYDQTNLRLAIPRDSLKNAESFLRNDYSDNMKYTIYRKHYNFHDSLRNIFIEKEYTVEHGKERLDYEAYFKGKRGLLTEYDSSGQVSKTDSVFDTKIVDADYDGGEDAWRYYLRKNLKAVTPAENGAPSGKYTVIIKFVVNGQGELEDIKAENDPGYGMAAEAIRVIRNSTGRWKPAFRYGRIWRAYRRQPVTFLVEG